jgi:hypothetical protein
MVPGRHVALPRSMIAQDTEGAGEDPGSQLN